MRIVLILPSLAAGGLEKVMTELAWYFSRTDNNDVTLISLVNGKFFYSPPPEIETCMPPFLISNSWRPWFVIRLLFWLRKKMVKIAPDALLSFGGKYNSFVLIASAGLKVRTYISDRSRPTISYGRFLDILNPFIYRRSSGIIAQTGKAVTELTRVTGHSNIIQIGNPIHIPTTDHRIRKKIILNVGRFVRSKQQSLLIRYFSEINPREWNLWFIGDGTLLEEAKMKARELNVNDRVKFLGVVGDIEKFYQECSIFAFTSNSEGFPNSLGEAMANGMACVSFDCEAGPSDLIEDKENGYLVAMNNHKDFISKLKILIQDESLRIKFGQKAVQKASQFHIEKIGKKYMDFMYGKSNANIN